MKNSYTVKLGYNEQIKIFGWFKILFLFGYGLPGYSEQKLGYNELVLYFKTKLSHLT